MNSKKGPQYISADGRFTRQRPDFMSPRGMHTPNLDEYVGAPKTRKTRVRNEFADIRFPDPHPFKYPKISEEAAQKIAQALSIMLNDRSERGRR